MTRVAALSLLAVVLAGCAARRDFVWSRLDGAAVSDAQLQSDLAICNAEARKIEMTARRADWASLDDIAIGCMAQRGYRPPR